MHLSPFFPETIVVGDGVGVVTRDLSIDSILPCVESDGLGVEWSRISGVISTLRVVVGRISITKGGGEPVLLDLLTCLEIELVRNRQLVCPFPSGRLRVLQISTSSSPFTS